MRDSLITLTVYFSGTGGKILDSSGLHGYLFQHTHEDDLYQRHGLDGCGITHGVLGVYFGRGVEEHAKKVYQKVLELLKEGKRVRLNCFGYSRGAISALLLAKMLGDYPMDRVEVNLALADPVPGNLFFQVKMDLLSTTLANKAMNFSECKNLNKILVLYVNDPRPNQYGECPEFIISAHAPLFPVYPLFTATERVIIPGCHNGMMWTHYKQAGDEFLQGEEKQQIY